MKILVIDIETRPNLAHVWGLFNQNVGLPQLIEEHDLFCFAAHWYGGKEMIFKSVYHDGYKDMVQTAWELLDEADVIVHFNGKKFDIPHMNRTFVMLGMNPPAPYKQVDLLNVVKSQFRFASNKLAHVSVALGLGEKEEHEGHELWVKCLAGEASAWNKMRKYNKQDVVLTTKLYDRLLPWIKSHPNYNLFVDEDDRRCPNCGSKDLYKRGYSYTNVSRFQRYCCNKCGAWSRGRTNNANRKQAIVGVV